MLYREIDVIAERRQTGHLDEDGDSNDDVPRLTRSMVAGEHSPEPEEQDAVNGDGRDATENGEGEENLRLKYDPLPNQAHLLAGVSAGRQQDP